MPILKDYHQFDGLTWATGYLRNVLAYQGATAPHTGQPYSEALLMGINGGIAAGYFAFEYEGHDPHLHFLTLYPFNEEPGSVFERLSIPMNTRQTTNAEKGTANVISALAQGTPAVVWLDVITLNRSQITWGVDKDYWLIMPVVVYGYEKDQVYIADRACVPTIIDGATFAASRSRIGKIRHRIMTIGNPDPNKLPAAVEAGIRDCIKIMTGEPPVGAKSSWGFDAYKKWMDLLGNSKNKASWAKQFAPGQRMYAGLVSSYRFIEVWFTGGSGARHTYADFLDEAAQILGKPALREVAQHFRTAATHWKQFASALLPDSIALFKEARELLNREYELFLTQRGAQTLAEQEQIAQRLDAIKQELSAQFPLTEQQAATMRSDLRDHIQRISDTEKVAFDQLKEVMK